MIKSKILNGLNDDVGLSWGLVFLGIATAVFLRAVIFGERYPMPLEAFIGYPVLIISGLLFMRVSVKKLFKNWENFELKVLPTAAWLALISGFLIALLPFWGRAMAGMPLSLSQIGTYFLTLGVYPLGIGPDGFLRGFAWALGIVLGLGLYRETKNYFSSIAAGLLGWLVLAVIFVLPSVILIMTMGFNSLPMTSVGSVMVGEFTRLNLFSYWGDGQLLRWFTGFGGQAANALLLYTASWVFVIGGMCWALVNFSTIKQAFAGFKGAGVFTGLAVVLFGYFAGVSHQDWSGLDLAAWGVFVIILLIAWLYKRFEYLAITPMDSLMQVMFILGLMLLGWPVALGGLFLMVIIQYKNQVGMMNSPEWGRLGADAFIKVAMVLLFVLFMRRGAELNPIMLRIIIMFALFSFLAEFVRYAKKANYDNLRIMIGLVVTAVLLWVAAGMFSPVAILLLPGVFMWIFWRKILQSKLEPESFVWGIAIIVLLAVIWLPRLAHPELIPR